MKTRIGRGVGGGFEMRRSGQRVVVVHGGRATGLKCASAPVARALVSKVVLHANARPSATVRELVNTSIHEISCARRFRTRVRRIPKFAGRVL